MRESSDRVAAGSGWVFCSCFFAPPALRALLGALLGFFESIRFAFEGDDLAVVGEAIDQGDDAGGVGEDLVPFGERSI